MNIENTLNLISLKIQFNHWMFNQVMSLNNSRFVYAQFYIYAMSNSIDDIVIKDILTMSNENI